MRDIITDFQKANTWKVQLTISINFISSKDVNDERVIHSKRNTTEFFTYDNVNDVADELFESLLSIWQIGLETSMRERNV